MLVKKAIAPLHKSLSCIFAFSLMMISMSAMGQANNGWKLDGNSEIARIIATAPENSWVKLNKNRFDSVWTPLEQRAVPPEATSAGTPYSVILAWSSMAWDFNRGDIIIWGGGHANYSGNEPYIWQSSTLNWTRAALPSEIHLIDPARVLYEVVDGVHNAPVSSHAYDNSEFFPVLDRFVVFGGAAYGSGHYFEHLDGSRTGPYFFNPALADENAVGGTTGSQVKPALFPEVIGKRMWSNRDNLEPPSPEELRPGTGLGFVNGTTAYANEGGVDVLYIQTGGELFRYAAPSLSDPSLDTYDLVGIAAFPFSGFGAGAYDAQRKIFVRTAGGYGDVFTFWDLSQTGIVAKNIIFTPDVINGSFDFSRIKFYGMDFDSSRQVFVLWDGNQDIWHLTPPEDLVLGTWTLSRITPASSSVPQNDTNSIGILGKWKYVRALDAFIGLFDQFSGDIWAYKPTNWQPEVETIGTFVATPQEGQIIYANEPLEINAFSLGNTASSMQFYMDGNLVGSSNSAPHSLVLNEHTTGAHTLTITAIHPDGTTLQSEPINIVSSSDSVETLILQNGLNDYTGTTDAYIYEFHNNVNFGEETSLLDLGSGVRLSSLVRFVVFQSESGPIADGSIIRQAKLSLYKSSLYDDTYQTHRVLSNWTESGVTWEQRESGILWSSPGVNDLGVDIAAIADSKMPVSVSFSPEWVTFDMTSSMQAMSADGLNYGWKLVPIGRGGNIKTFSSSEYIDDPTRRPLLEIEYISNSGPANFPPTVSLTAPLSGTEFEIGSPILLTATAEDTDGIVAKVAFYADGGLLGEVTNAPYEFNWTSPPAGVYLLTAIATDEGGKQTTSTGVSITITDPNSSNLAPTISLTTPVANAKFSVGTPIQFVATANDPDGLVTNVSFYADGNLLGEATQAPYEFNWLGALSGTYDLHAVVTDDDGNTTSSPTIQILVTAVSIPPDATSVSLRNGLNGYTGTTDSYIYKYHNNLNFGDQEILLVTANGPPHLSSLVHFTIFQSEGGPIPDDATITSATLALFKSSYYDHVFRAHRILNNWTETDITWEQRESGVPWNTPGASDFGLDINATADGEGAVMWEPTWLRIDVTSGVQAISNNLLNYGWKLVPISGNSNIKTFLSSEYVDDPTLRPTLEIEYVPNNGPINLPPTVSLTAPLSGTEFEIGTPILLTATADDPDGIVAKVAFYVDGGLLGEVTNASSYEFSWTNPPAGVHTLTAIATDDDGKQATSLAVSVTVSDLINVPPTVTMTNPVADSKHGVGAPILLTATANDADGTVVKVAFYANGNLLGEVTQPPYEFTWLNAQEGMHALQAVATDNGALIGKSELFEITVSQSTTGNNHQITLQNGLSGYNGAQDSYVYKFHNFSNFGGETTLYEASKGPFLGIFIQFSIFEFEGGPIPNNAVITAATLRLYKTSFYDHVYRVHPLLSAWSENQITWEENQSGTFWNEPGGTGLGIDITAEFDGENSVSWNPDWLRIDVTQGLQAIKAGRTNYGWRLMPISGNTNIKTFISSEYAEDPTLRPALEVEYLLQ